MKVKLFLLFLIIIGFFYRVYGLDINHSFWTDEEHVALFARAILERGQPVLANGYSTGVYQWPQYWLSAISAKIFGLNEFAIRFPSVIFGALTIWAVYFLGKELFNKNVGLVAAFFTTFLKIEILWSRQARPYQALQFFYLLSAWLLCKLSKKDKFEWKYFAGFLGCGILASLMHGLGLLILLSGFLYLLICRPHWLKKEKIFLGLIPLLFFVYLLRAQAVSLLARFGQINNLFYYRVFLTHNYLPFCLLAFLGIGFLIRQKKYRELFLPIIFLSVQIFIASFLLIQPFTRYFYPAFPFVIILATYSLINLVFFLKSWFIKQKKLAKYLIMPFVFLVFFLLILTIILPKNKFAFLPRKVYSLNEDMQEIPEVDWKKIYQLVGQKLSQNQDAVLATNWNDLPIWYLGEDKLNYLLRRTESLKKDPLSGAEVVSNLERFLAITEKGGKGIVVIDSWDNYLPVEIRSYIRSNFKKELEIDRLYPTQPRYWPVEVYSWGNLK